MYAVPVRLRSVYLCGVSYGAGGAQAQRHEMVGAEQLITYLAKDNISDEAAHSEQQERAEEKRDRHQNEKRLQSPRNQASVATNGGAPGDGDPSQGKDSARLVGDGCPDAMGRVAAGRLRRAEYSVASWSALGAADSDGNTCAGPPTPDTAA
jgi:hypothetical protein